MTTKTDETQETARTERGTRSSRYVRLLPLLPLLLLWTSAPALPQDSPESTAAPVKKIKMYAENWKWIPNVIRVEQGTLVSIDFVSRDASHSFLIKKGYQIKVLMPEGSERHHEFLADKAGEFVWRCGRPCGNGCPKMRGKLIVEPTAAEDGDEGAE